MQGSSANSDSKASRAAGQQGQGLHEQGTEGKERTGGKAAE
jgi:hypothetical protein